MKTKLLVTALALIPLVSIAGYSIAMSPERNKYTEDVYPISGELYPIAIANLEGTSHTWATLAPFMPKELFAKDAEKKTPEELLATLEEMKKLPAQQYGTGLDELTQKVNTAHPDFEKEHHNTNVFLGEYITDNGAEELKIMLPEFKQDIDQLVQVRNTYNALVMISENVQFNQNIQKASKGKP